MCIFVVSLLPTVLYENTVAALIIRRKLAVEFCQGNINIFESFSGQEEWQNY